MSERQHYIRTDKPADQAMTAYAVRRIADWFDIADDRSVVTVYPNLGEDKTWQAIARAWMWAALLITDIAEVDSVTLRSLANSVSRGVQGELAY